MAKPDQAPRVLTALYHLESATSGNRAARAAAIDAALKSAVRAVLPGRQQRGNLKPFIDAGRKAFIRTLRRRAK